MSKHKFMIYFLTTTLVLPTFTTSIAHAEDTNEDAKMKSSSTQEEQIDHNEYVNDNNINEASQPDDTQSDNTFSEAPTKEDSKNKIKRENLSHQIRHQRRKMMTTQAYLAVIKSVIKIQITLTVHPFLQSLTQLILVVYLLLTFKS